MIKQKSAKENDNMERFDIAYDSPNFGVERGSRKKSQQTIHHTERLRSNALIFGSLLY